MATYNVHGCVGLDGNFSPERVLDVIREIDPDVIGLQETGAWGWGGADQIAFLARELSYVAVAGPTHQRPRGPFGNALLVRGLVRAVRTLDLGVDRCEPRGAIDADVVIGEAQLRIVNTHLGLRARERGMQVDRLLAGIGAWVSEAPLVVMADFNEWLPNAGPLKRMHERFGRSPAMRTFPAGRPFLPLDRIWVQPEAAVRSRGVHKTKLARVASDHLPVVVRLDPAALRG